MDEEYKTTKEEDIIFPKANIPEEEVKPEVEVKKPQEEPKEEPQSFKQVRKENIREFNDKPGTKQYDAKLIPNGRIVGAWIVIITLILILTISMIWGNTLKSKFLDKDFSTNVNIEPTNVSVEVTDADVTNNDYVHNIYINQTIVNNVTVINPGNFS